MLTYNYSYINGNAVSRGIGGPTNPVAYYHLATCMNFYTGDAVTIGVTDKFGFNPGYRPPYSFVLAPKEGGLGSTGNTFFTATLTSGGSMGLNATSDLSAVFSIPNADLQLIVSALANLGAVFSTTASVLGVANATADLSFNASITASLGALANAVASLSGTFTVTGATPSAIGNMSADISTVTVLSPENLAAAVWNSVAASFNNAGTMGEIMNNMGAVSDPWGVVLPGTYTGEQAGKIVADLETLIRQVKALTAAQL